MQQINGILLSRLPFENLYKVKDLIYYDGPLLSLFKTKNNQNYLFYWIDQDHNFNRWLVVNIKNTNLQAYLKNKLSLYQILTKPKNNSIYKVDIDKDLNYHNILKITPKQIPQSYLPVEV